MVAPRRKILDLDVDRMRCLGHGDLGGGAQHPVKSRIVGELPFDPDRSRRRATLAVLGNGVDGKPRPQRHAAGPGISGGDTQPEGVLALPRSSSRRSLAAQRRGAQRRQGCAKEGPTGMRQRRYDG
jgi:hypothetical protein